MRRDASGISKIKKYEIVQAIQRFRLEDLFEKSDMKMETWDLKIAKSWNVAKKIVEKKEVFRINSHVSVI